jgi:hypothetical protein
VPPVEDKINGSREDARRGAYGTTIDSVEAYINGGAMEYHFQISLCTGVSVRFEC